MKAHSHLCENCNAPVHDGGKWCSDCNWGQAVRALRGPKPAPHSAATLAQLWPASAEVAP